MPARTLPGLGLTGFWPIGGDAWKPTMDHNMLTLSVVVSGAALSRQVELPATPAEGDIYIVPASDATNPNEVAVFDGEAGSEAWVYLTPKAGWSFLVTDENKNYQFDGTEWAEFASAGGGSGGSDGGAYDIRFGFTSAPTADQVLDTIPLARTVTLGENFAGSVAVVGSAPAANFTISVRLDSTEIGTLTIGTDSSATFATTAAAEAVIPSGGVLTFVAPSTVDASIGGVSATLLGNF